MSGEAALTLTLADEAETIRLGEDLALALNKGDWIALSGDLGAGKSTFARAFLRALGDEDELEVPSPTFTLVQSYELRIPVAHFDLYRLGDASELDELGFDEALSSGICLVEWPEVADALLPQAAFSSSSNRAAAAGPRRSRHRRRRCSAFAACWRSGNFSTATVTPAPGGVSSPATLRHAPMRA